MKFDAIVTNPPYSNSSHKESKNTLWRKWFEFDKLIVDGGVFAEVIPASWMGSPPLMKKYFLDEEGLKRNITYLNRDECKKHFPSIGSNYSYFVYLKERYENKTEVIAKNVNGEVEEGTINLNDLIFGVIPKDLSKQAESILSKTLNSHFDPKNNILKMILYLKDVHIIHFSFFSAIDRTSSRVFCNLLVFSLNLK